MTHRHFLTAALAAAMLLTACASNDVPDTDDAVIEQPTADSTTGTDTSATEQPSNAGHTVDDTPGGDTTGGDTIADGTVGDDRTDDTTRVTPAHAAGDTDYAAEQDAAAGARPAAVALTLDGRRAPIAAVCNGVDGAVLATTEGEVTVTLVREAGTTLRYQGEGMTAETDEVQVEQTGAGTVYRGTLESEQVPAVDVELELGDTSTLEDC